MADFPLHLFFLQLKGPFFLLGENPLKTTQAFKPTLKTLHPSSPQPEGPHWKEAAESSVDWEHQHSRAHTPVSQSFHRQTKKSHLCIPAPFFHWHFPGQKDPVMTSLSLVTHSPLDIFFHTLISDSSMETSTEEPAAYPFLFHHVRGITS